MSELLSEYHEEINDDDEVYDVFFALADVMWKKGRLTEEIKETALALIEKEEQFGRWEGEKLRKARRRNLDKLKEKLNSEMPPRKKIPVHKPYMTDLEVGNVYYFQIINNVKQCEEDVRPYEGWYALMYIDKIIKDDWQVRGVYDDVAEAYFFIQKNKPESVSEIKFATPVWFYCDKGGNRRYRSRILETSKRARKREIHIVGKLDEFSYPPNEERNYNPFSWYWADRSIVWGYKKQLKLGNEMHKNGGE